MSLTRAIPASFMRVERQARVDVDEVERILVAVVRTTGSSDARTTRRMVSRIDEVDAAAEEVVVEAVAVVDAMVDVTVISLRMKSSTAAMTPPLASSLPPTSLPITRSEAARRMHHPASLLPRRSMSRPNRSSSRRN